jgi:hypothetical protein
MILAIAFTLLTWGFIRHNVSDAVVVVAVVAVWLCGRCEKVEEVTICTQRDTFCVGRKEGRS